MKLRLALLASVVLAVGLGGCAVRHDYPRSGFGHAEDHSWLVGRLESDPSAKDGLRLRYIPADEASAQADPHGGAIRLGNPLILEGFSAGQWVRAWGRLEAAPQGAAGPIYSVHRIERIAGPW